MANETDALDRLAAAIEDLPVKFAEEMNHRDATQNAMTDLRRTIMGASSPEEATRMIAEAERDKHDRMLAARSERRANIALVLSGLAAVATVAAAIAQLT